MRIGVVNEETWRFFDPVFAEFQAHHQTEVFQRRRANAPVLKDRLNRFRLRRDLTSILDGSDVVFFEWASGLLAQASKLPKRCAIVTRLHRYEMYHWVDQINWEAVDRIILVSEAKRREFSRRFPRQAAKISVVPEAISPDQFKFQEKEFDRDLGILCHLSPRKRVYELILAFTRLVRQDGDYHLHIGGGPHGKFPEYEGVLHSLVRRLDLEKQVTFYGPVADPPSWYRNIDVFISNSYSEGLQVSPIEAMASGCYCLSHWWDGADELLPAEQLFFGDDELIGKLQSYTDISPSARSAIRRDQRRRVEDRFNVHDVKVRIRQLVEEAAHNWDGQIRGQ